MIPKECKRPAEVDCPIAVALKFVNESASAHEMRRYGCFPLPPGVGQGEGHS